MTKLLGKDYNDKRTITYRTWHSAWLDFTDNPVARQNMGGKLFVALADVLFWGMSADIHANYGADVWTELCDELQRVLE